MAQEKRNKEVFSNGDNLIINSENKKLIARIKGEIEILLQKAEGDSNVLLDYIKHNGTKIYIKSIASKILPLIKEEYGFITEQKGHKAILLSLVTGQGIKFETQPMFLFAYNDINFYYLLLHFYKWYSYKAGLAGFDYETQEDFKQYLLGKPMTKLPMQKIIQLEQALARDKEATDFVVEYKKRIDGSKNVLNKIKNDGSAKI